MCIQLKFNLDFCNRTQMCIQSKFDLILLIFVTGHRWVQVCGEWVETFSGPNEISDDWQKTETGGESFPPS